MSVIDDFNWFDFFQEWVEKTELHETADEKVFALVKKAYKTGYEQGYETRQQFNFDEWNQK
jgi:hypothetical protein